MNNPVKEILDMFDLFEQLKKYSFEIGLFENASKEVEINVLNTDGTNTKITMALDDVLYLTEHGTLTIPGVPIIKKIKQRLNEELRLTLNVIKNGIISGTIKDEGMIRTILSILPVQINSEISNIIQTIVSSKGALSKILKKDDENIYLFNPVELGKYIKCKLFIK